MKTVFLSVIGGGHDYDLFLGCLEKHLPHGDVIVVDTCPKAERRQWELPSGVHWFHCDLFGRGAKAFRFATALNVAIGLAEERGAELLIQADADEYYESDLSNALTRAAQGTVVDVKTIHHIAPGVGLDFPGEWHRRIFPAGRGIRFRPNPRHENPEFHPIVDVPLGMSIERETLTPGHHLHYAVGEKKHDLHTAQTTIPGWPDAGQKVTVPPWPKLIEWWSEGGPRPSESFKAIV